MTCPDGVGEALAAFAPAVPGLGSLGVTRPPHAAVACVFMVDDRYVLRGRADVPGVAADLDAETALIDRVRGLLPWRLPDLVRLPSGASLVRAGGMAWTLYPALPGRILWPWQTLHRAPEADRRRLVETLRALHDRTRGRLGPGDPGRLCRDLARRLPEVRALLSPAAAGQVDAALERAARAATQRTDADLAFVHGDFHWGNVLADDRGEPTGLLDLDWCRVAAPVEDLGYLAMMLVRSDPRDGPHRPDDLRRIGAWYGLDPREAGDFADHVLLYAAFDVHLFGHAAGLADRDRWVGLQIGLVEAECRNSPQAR
ncbi:MAG: aminoglycoside phosphotransferase family protein [Deltaproteobacteria bacterium]|nr:aminoglycoside phosphotransferase family protein [Deltaproteobacteria bacterium]